MLRLIKGDRNEKKKFKIDSNLVIKKHQIIKLIIMSIIMVFTLEILSRRSIPQGFGFIMMNPLMFVFNVMIVLLTLSISMMFARRNFMLILISVLWLGLGITNFVIMTYRSTPLTAMDFYLLKSVAEIFDVYLDTIKLVLISIVLAVVLIVMFFLWRKVNKYQIQIRIPLLIIGVTSVSMLMLSTFALKVSALSDDFGNLPDAYADYGFAYCFSNSVFERGIREPEGYSEEMVNKVLEEIETGSGKKYNNPDTVEAVDNETQAGGMIPLGLESASTEEIKPNIIMIQLESFFDVNKLLDYSFSENPVPNFTRLKSEYSSGYLKVPAYGAGTVNTEFEILSSMSIDFFGTGEYPYRTILQSTTAESIAYNLTELGYHNYIIHNNTGTFYNRNTILPKLGFDNFASIEYMNNIENNPTGWAKDHALVGEILTALNAEETSDFVYAITVQAHGKYLETLNEENTIKIAADPNKRLRLGAVTEKDVVKYGIERINISESYLNQLEYYANQLSQTDQFIGELTEKLAAYDEPTVVVFFGDHLPPLSFEEDNLINGNKFQTEYVVWSNYPMENVKLDLTAYQLSPYVLERVGYENGLLTKFHQRCMDNPEYLEELKLLQYDMLYGEKYVYDGVNPYIEKPMKMGTKEIKITNIAFSGESIYVYGENFTPWSVVSIDGNAKDTTFINECMLSIPYEELADPKITIIQETDSNKILSESEVWIKQ